jgi:hypothetical protein
MQRFGPAARRGFRSSPSARRASLPTSRSPTQNLLSPFGAVLHGSSRGPHASFAEPPDAWLAVLADSVPFYKDCLLICPSTSPRAQVQRAWDRCREHIPTAHVGTLCARIDANHGHPALSASANAEAVQRVSRLPLSSPSQSCAKALAVGAAEPVAHTAASLLLSSSPSSSSVVPAQCLPSASSRPLPSLHSPLEDVPAHSLDLVVFANNVFAQEMLFDAPWHLSLAHRALRPHGVVAIVGHVTDVDVAAPEWAARCCAECLTAVHDEARHDLELAAREVVQMLPSSQLHVRGLRRALEVQETLRTGHSDVFFPFPSVRRRWFISEYAVDPSQLTASCRASPLYQALYAPAGSLWRSTAHHALQQASRHGDRDHNGGAVTSSSDGGLGGVDDDSFFFVDISMPSVDETHRETNQRGCGGTAVSDPTFVDRLCASWSPPGVQRRRGTVDPLDALQALLEAHTRPNHLVRDWRATAPPPLRVQMRHFVITCSSRSMNATSPGEEAPRLQGSVSDHRGKSVL